MIENSINVFNFLAVIFFSIALLSTVSYFIGFHLSKGWYRGRNLIEEDNTKD